MMYLPDEVFNVREALGGAIVQAVLRAAGDFIAGTNQPWSYYLGMAFGGAALATGIPGAAATIYVIGDTLDYWIFKSPDASELRLFLNGVQITSLDTYAATSVWELIQNLPLVPGAMNELTFVNFAASALPGATGIPFLAIGDITVNGATAYAQPKFTGDELVDIISYSVRDSEANSPNASYPLYIPSGSTLAVIQAYSDIFAPLLDAATGGVIESASLQLGLTLPGGLKATPTANILNERGATISFNTSGPRADSIWIPAISPTLMPGNELSLTVTAIANIITHLTTSVAAGGGNVRAVTPQNYNWVTARSGKRSLRR